MQEWGYMAYSCIFLVHRIWERPTCTSMLGQLVDQNMFFYHVGFFSRQPLSVSDKCGKHRKLYGKSMKIIHFPTEMPGCLLEGAEDALDDDGRSALDYARAQQQVPSEALHQQIDHILLRNHIVTLYINTFKIQ